MEHIIEIKHQGTNYKKRRKAYLLAPLLAILFFVMTDILNEHYFYHFIPATTVIIAPFLLFISFWLIRQTRFYLLDFISDGNTASLKFLDKVQEINITVALQDVDVELKNKTSRLGFNCEIRLSIPGARFVINDRFDWTQKEMKELFIYIMAKNNHELTGKDRFNLTKMDR